MLSEEIKSAGLRRPENGPKEWVVDCQFIGTGDKTIVYLGRYLYRGVIREKDILANENGNVTYRYKNSKRLIRVLQYLFKIDTTKWFCKMKNRPRFICPCCGTKMKIVRTRIRMTEKILRPEPL